MTDLLSNSAARMAVLFLLFLAVAVGVGVLALGLLSRR